MIVSNLRFLADTSALVRLFRDPGVLEEWQDVVDAGLVSTCPITELELLHTARSWADRQHQQGLLRDMFGWVVMPDRVFDQAIEIQEALTARGSHRSADSVDLLTAVAASHHRLVLLHYDRDFVQVARVTGQRVRWLADPGSIN
jgi:predicted nucleic acid-binding protein